MKTMQELAPIWTKAWDEAFAKHEIVPAWLSDQTVNGITPDIDRPSTCFIGEARGGGCYYGKGSYEYCKECHKYSMKIFDIAGDAENDRPVQHRYDQFCQEYAVHFNKEHNGDRCKD